jgi:hypothetical protein
MNRKRSLSQKDRLNNQPASGAREPEGAADTSFDPAALNSPESESSANGSPAPDPFDPASLRLAPNLTTAGGVKKAIVSLRVGKPEPAWWSRVHPAAEYRIQTAVLEVKGESKMGVEVYLIPASFHAELVTDPCFHPCILALAITRQGDLFIWRVNLPRDSERSNAWSESAREAMDRATKRWVRVAANMRAGAYDVWEATGQIPDPVWPDLPFPDLLRVAFKDHYISKLDHPILRQLHGEV